MTKITLKPHKTFNSVDFYQKGAVYLRVDRKLSERLSSAINNLDWRYDEEEGLEAPYGIRPEIEDEFSQGEYSYNDNVNPDFPKDVRDSVSDLLLGDAFFQMNQCFDFKINVADIWDGCDPEGLPWHYDGVTSDDIVLLFYLSENKGWKPEFGGHLEIGIRTSSMLNDPNIYTGTGTEIENGIESICVVPPKIRNLVVLNNKNPYFLHKVHKILKPDLSRRTMLLGLNLLKKKNEDDSKVIWNFHKPESIRVS